MCWRASGNIIRRKTDEEKVAAVLADKLRWGAQPFLKPDTAEHKNNVVHECIRA